MKRVLFLCTENSCRSQMAEAITRHFWGDTIEAYSAGVRPKGVNPMAKRALEELGIGDLERLQSKSLDRFIHQEMDLVVTLCDSAADECPYFPGARERIHLPFKDPSKGKEFGQGEIDDFIKVAKEIKGALDALFKERGWI